MKDTSSCVPSPQSALTRSVVAAINSGTIKEVKFFLKCGVNPNSRTETGLTLLMCALLRDNDSKRPHLVRSLLSHGANPMLRDVQNGRSALLWACALGRHEETRMILDECRGEIDLFEKDDHGLTALHYATQIGSADVVRSLIKAFYLYRLSLDVRDSMGMTPYLLARKLGQREIAEILRVEGRSSQNCMDTGLFRTAREWSTVGQLERRQLGWDEYQRDLGSYRIQGRVALINRLNMATKQLKDNNQFLPDVVPIEALKVKNKNIRGPQRNTILVDICEDDSTDKPTFQRSESIKSTMVSMLDLASTKRGRLVKDFHRSEPGGENGVIGGDLNVWMTAVSEQKHGSFRKPAKEIPKPIIPLPPIKRKAKVSSLAIILGRRKRTKLSARKSRVSNNSTNSRENSKSSNEVRNVTASQTKRSIKEPVKKSRDLTHEMYHSSLVRSRHPTLPEIVVH